jgi:hypothetical protein
LPSLRKGLLTVLIPKRVSALLVTAKFRDVSILYGDLGFTRIKTDDPGCVGYVAGETGIILADRAFAIRCWGAEAAAVLTGKFVPYVFLGQLDSETQEHGRVVADTQTWFGTHEQVIQTVSGPVVLVETVE